MWLWLWLWLNFIDDWGDVGWGWDWLWLDLDWSWSWSWLDLWLWDWLWLDLLDDWCDVCWGWNWLRLDLDRCWDWLRRWCRLDLNWSWSWWSSRNWSNGSLGWLVEDTWRGADGGLGVAGDWWCNGVALAVDPDGGGQEDGLGNVDVVGHNDELALGVLVGVGMGVAPVRLGSDTEGTKEDGAEGDEGGLHGCG